MLRDLDLRWLIALHLTRFVGFYFLFLYYRGGALPWAFAVLGGWGDIVVAALGGALLALGGDLSRRVTILVPLIVAGHVVVFYRLGLAPGLERRQI